MSSVGSWRRISVRGRLGRSGRSEIALAVLLAGCFGTVMFDRMAQLYLGPYLIEDLRLGPEQIGLLAGVVSICWAVSTLLFGVVSDRFGRKRVLVPAMVAFSLLSWISGLAGDFGQLLAIRALLGLAEGPCWSVIMALMDESSLSANRGRNIGVVVCAGPLIGSALGPILTTQIAQHFGWRGAFFAAGVPGLVLAGVVAAVVVEPHTTRSCAVRMRGRELATLAQLPSMWLCFAAALLLTVWVFAFNAFAPLFLTATRHFTPGMMGLILGASGFGGFAYCLAGPTLSDRFGRRPAILATATIATALPLLVLIPRIGAAGLAAVSLLATSGPALAALAMVIVPMEIAPPALAATAVGFVSIGGDAIGASLGPIIGGKLTEEWGFAAPLVMAAAAAAGIVVIGLFLRETRER